MPHDVFISYASQDKAIADATCAALEARKIRCWMASRDVLPGTEYGEAIDSAILDCRALVLVFSGRANEAPMVRREVERAVSRGKIVVPLRVEDVVPSRAMGYFLSSTHWLDALTPPLEAHLARLAEVVLTLLGTQTESTTAIPSPVQDSATHPKFGRSAIAFAVSALVIVFATGLYGIREWPPAAMVWRALGTEQPAQSSQHVPEAPIGPLATASTYATQATQSAQTDAPSQNADSTVLKPGIRSEVTGPQSTDMGQTRKTKPASYKAAQTKTSGSAVPGGPGTPALAFTSVPPIGSMRSLTGVALHVKPSDYVVLVYIQVSGGWWMKPTLAAPKTSIAPDGTWICNITTGGHDQDATAIAAFLVPANSKAPIVLGTSTLPPELMSSAVASLKVTRP